VDRSPASRAQNGEEPTEQRAAGPGIVENRGKRSHRRASSCGPRSDVNESGALVLDDRAPGPAAGSRLPVVPDLVAGAEVEELEPTVGVLADREIGRALTERLAVATPIAVRRGLPDVADVLVGVDVEELEPAAPVLRDRDPF